MASARSAASVAQSPMFQQSVEALFNSWEAMRLAILHATGGHNTAEKAKWLMGCVVTYFGSHADVSYDDISEYIGDIMDLEFDMYIEDGSLEELGRSLCEAFRLLADGKEEELRQKLATLRAPDLSQVRDVSGEDPEEFEVEEGGDGAGSSGASQSGPSQASSAPRRNQQPPSGSGGSSSGGASAMETDEDGWTTVARGKKK